MFDPCGTPAGERGKAYHTKWQVSNKSEHRSCVLIIIIGYWRLTRSIFDVQVCYLDIVLKCKTLKSRFRRRQRKEIKVIVIHILMQQKTKSYRSSPRKRMFLQQVLLYIALSKSTRELQISVEIRDRNFCSDRNCDQLAYIYYR